MFGISWFLVGAGADVPVIDDWVYAWSVEDLLKTGRLHVLSFSAVYPIAQLLWGGLFARIFGFSFAVLRLSTVTLSIAGCYAVYLTLREMGCSADTAILGGLALAFHPVYFVLSFSFMTEVPFIATTAWTFYWLARAVRRGEERAFWAAAVCSVGAFLVRPVAITVPMAMFVAVGWARRWKLAAAPLLALAVMIALQLTLPKAFGPLYGVTARIGFIQQWTTVPLASYARWTVEVVMLAAFPLLPLWIGQLTTRRNGALITVVTLFVTAVCRWGVGYFISPLPNWQTWSLQDMGGARALVGGALQKSHWSMAIEPLMKVVGLAGTGVLAVVAVDGVRRRRQWRGDELTIASFVVLYIALVHALWFYNDRYYVVFAPALAIVGARALDGNRVGKVVASVGIAALAFVALTGTRELLAFNRTLDRTARELEASGIPPWDIDAGYVINGWRLYAHPEHGRPGSDRRYEVPFVTSSQVTPYSISSSPLPDSEVIRVIPLPEVTWQASRELYLLRRHP